MLPHPNSAADTLSRLYQSVPTTQVAAVRALSSAAYRLRSDEDVAADARLRHEIVTEARAAASSSAIKRAERAIYLRTAEALACHRDVEAQTAISQLPSGTRRWLYVGLVDALICGLYARVEEVLGVWSRTGDERAALRALGCEVMS